MCPRGGGNWGTLRIPAGKIGGTLGKIRGITTPPKQNPIIIKPGRLILGSYPESVAARLKWVNLEPPGVDKNTEASRGVFTVGKVVEEDV